MVEWRIYRAALIPAVLAMLVCAFSLASRPRADGTTLAPDAFDGRQATALLQSLAAQFPDRRPGGVGDGALAQRVSREFLAARDQRGVPEFTVSSVGSSAATIDGSQTLQTVIARRPGANNRAIVLLAHRDAAGHGAAAELSGTASLLALARVFAGRVTNRTLVLVSTSGGTGGAAGAAYFAAHTGGPVDAVLVLGDLGGASLRRPLIVPWSNSPVVAPMRLTRTVDAALSQELGSGAGSLGTAVTLARLSFPLSVSEQGVLNQHGLPAVTLGAAGELGPPTGGGVDSGHLQSLGRAALRAVNALDTARDLEAPQAEVPLGRRVLRSWAVRLLVGALLLAPLLTAIDAVARSRRRRLDVGAWATWALTVCAPFVLTAGFVVLSGRLGWLGPAPAAAASPRDLPVDGTARAALAAVALVFALLWLVRPWIMRRTVGRAPAEPAAGAAVALLGLSLLAWAIWARNPFAAALLVAPLHLGLLGSALSEHRRRAPALALWALGLVPLALLLFSYARQLGLGPLTGARMALSLLAGGHVGPLASLAWALAAGGVLALALLVRRGAESDGPQLEVRSRGPLTYAGPGSLGGTESALRR
ncbi:MAG TPA: M28 family peptidase [Solirubrobacteraceae bacterium]|jgi:hypothetical protein|nr:M28 family peptidase [Solirubrobacteraceae bacterium]